MTYYSHNELLKNINPDINVANSTTATCLTVVKSTTLCFRNSLKRLGTSLQIQTENNYVRERKQLTAATWNNIQRDALV